MGCAPSIAKRVIAARFEHSSWEECASAIKRSLDLDLSSKNISLEAFFSPSKTVAKRERIMRDQLVEFLYSAATDRIKRIEDGLVQYDKISDGELKLRYTALGKVTDNLAESDPKKQELLREYDTEVWTAIVRNDSRTRLGVVAWDAGLFQLTSLEHTSWGTTSELPVGLVQCVAADTRPGLLYKTYQADLRLVRDNFGVGLFPRIVLYTDDLEYNYGSPPAGEPIQRRPDGNLADSIIFGDSTTRWPGFPDQASRYQQDRILHEQAIQSPLAGLPAEETGVSDSLPMFLLDWAVKADADFVEECAPISDKFSSGKKVMSLKEALALTPDICVAQENKCWIFKDEVAFLDRSVDYALDALVPARNIMRSQMSSLLTVEAADTYFQILGNRLPPAIEDNYLGVTGKIGRSQAVYMLWRKLGNPMSEEQGAATFAWSGPGFFSRDLSGCSCSLEVARDAFGDGSFAARHFLDRQLMVYRHQQLGRDLVFIDTINPKGTYAGDIYSGGLTLAIPGGAR